MDSKFIEVRFRVKHLLPRLDSNDKTKDLSFCVSPYVWFEADEHVTYLGVRKEIPNWTTANSHYTVPAEPSKDPAAEVIVTFPIPEQRTGGSFGFHVFSREINYDGATGFMSVGCASLDINKSIVQTKKHSVPVLDLDGKAYGCLRIEMEKNEQLTSDLFPTCNCKEEDEKADAIHRFLKHHEEAIQKVFEGYRVKYHNNKSNVFTFFVSPSFPLPNAAPILAFVALSRKFVDVLQSSDGTTFPFLKNSIGLLSYWAKIAERFYMQRREGTKVQSLPARRANILSEFLTLPFRGMIYSLDTVERVDRRTHLTDQWIQLLNFPTLGMAFYDCEDGSLLVLQIYSLLYSITKDKALYNQVKKTEPELHQVIQMAMKYQAFFAICELGAESSGYTAHATVILLPHKQFKKAYKKQVANRPFLSKSESNHTVVTLDVGINVRFQDKDVPSLIAESTTYIDGAMVPTSTQTESDFERFFTDYETFRKPSWTVNKDLQERHKIQLSEDEQKKLTSFANVKSLPKTIPHDEFDKENGLAWVRRIRNRASMEMVLHRKVFRNVFCLMSPFAEQYTQEFKNPAKFEYYLLFRKEKGVYSYGAPLETFLNEGTVNDQNKPNGISLVRCGHISESDLADSDEKLDLHKVLRDFPIGSFPAAPGNADQEAALKELDTLIASKRDLVYYTRTPEDANETTHLQLMMTKYHKEKPFEHLTIPLANGLSTTAFYASESVSSGA